MDTLSLFAGFTRCDFSFIESPLLLLAILQLLFFLFFGIFFIYKKRYLIGGFIVVSSFIAARSISPDTASLIKTCYGWNLDVVIGVAITLIILVLTILAANSSKPTKPKR